MPTTITKPQHHTTSRLVRVDEIRPNPFRAIERYPLQDEKIEALRASIRDTSFWDNIVARIGGDGHLQLAYGHHRLEALRRELGDDFEFRLIIIKDLSDEQMLKMMLRDNMEEWHTNALVDQASVRALVDAYTGGIHLPTPKAKTPKATLRYAPGFRKGDVPGGNRQHPYTAATLAAYLEWDRTKVETTLAALELIERKMVDEDLYKGLTQTQAGLLTTEVRKVVHDGDKQAKELEKQADAARKQAAEAEPGKERDAHDKLAESALQEAAAVRKRLAKQAAHVAWSAHLLVQDGAVTRAVSAQLKGLHKPPPLPRPRDNKEPGDEIAEYLDRLPEYTAHVQEVRAHAELFSPEQITEAERLEQAHGEALAALQSKRTEVVRQRQQRGGAAAPVASPSRKAKATENQPRRYGVAAKKRRQGAKALPV